MHKYVLLNENQFDFMCRIVRGRDYEKMTQFKLDVTHLLKNEPLNLLEGSIYLITMSSVMLYVI
ncbi:hypothetical protein [Arsenophonus sp. PmNCSU2021_1]|uniref:hypothetical protein n=1 Tax=Arsenophonus sp. PmNCSU2021_1 TaxID=3118989 RepID=UPI002FF3ACD4